MPRTLRRTCTFLLILLNQTHHVDGLNARVGSAGFVQEGVEFVLGKKFVGPPNVYQKVVELVDFHRPFGVGNDLDQILLEAGGGFPRVAAR